MLDTNVESFFPLVNPGFLALLITLLLTVRKKYTSGPRYWNKNGLVLSNTCVPVSGTWSIPFPSASLGDAYYYQLNFCFVQKSIVQKSWKSNFSTAVVRLQQNQFGNRLQFCQWCHFHASGLLTWRRCCRKLLCRSSPSFMRDLLVW